jgi:hypothetical protein
LGGGNEWTAGGEGSGFAVDVDELLLLLEGLESSLGVLVEPARLVLSTLVMVVLCIEQLMDLASQHLVDVSEEPSSGSFYNDGRSCAELVELG